MVTLVCVASGRYDHARLALAVLDRAQAYDVQSGWASSVNRMVVLALSKAFRVIRDPSDGSVRQPKSAPGFQASQNYAERDPSVMPDSLGADTGLPPLPSKPKDIAQLEKSREWLQSYKSQKGQ